MAQLVGLEQGISAQGSSMIKRIEDRADKMNIMITEILHYSKITRQPIIPQAIDMKTLITEIVSDHNIKQDSNQLEVTIGETPVINGDPIMVAQVFSNLIGNAIKYSTHGQKGIVHINGIKEERGICYTITDNGIGINESSVEKVFDLFHRMDNVEDIEGTGVGLAIVKRIVEKHHGNIQVKSIPGEGSAFTVCFPHVIY